MTPFPSVSGGLLSSSFSPGHSLSVQWIFRFRYSPNSQTRYDETLSSCSAWSHVLRLADSLGIRTSCPEPSLFDSVFFPPSVLHPTDTPPRTLRTWPSSPYDFEWPCPMSRKGTEACHPIQSPPARVVVSALSPRTSLSSSRMPSTVLVIGCSQCHQLPKATEEPWSCCGFRSIPFYDCLVSTLDFRDVQVKLANRLKDVVFSLLRPSPNELRQSTQIVNR